jgi:tRNA(fMet)-specific endonuclease VapC
MFCLDTNVVIGFLTGRLPRVRERLALEMARQTPINLPVIVWFELLYGAEKSDFPERNVQRLMDFRADRIGLWEFEPDDAAEAGTIRAHLEREGTPIGSYDILIAAQARRRSVTLVTRNVREFERVSGLQVEDWSV